MLYINPRYLVYLRQVGKTSTAMAARMEAAQPEQRLRISSAVAAPPCGTSAAATVARPHVNMMPPGTTAHHK